ncbi:zinc-binding alcohol dehydrogenase family protein [Streptomyces sp. NPDC005900]|uniref:quinone oxidoreductase family protein n=1 Tax=Streptomyces sp. NPDC005900 TaxID=3154569 RepID=UPI0033DC9154
MRVLVVDEEQGAPPDHWSAIAEHTVRGRALRFGLAEAADTAFDPAADHNREYVLARVRAFSLNYRDTALALGEHAEGTHDRGRGFGSDFVAEVAATGSAVRGLRPGDRVIPSMDWPPRPGDTVSAGVVTNTASRELQRVHHSRLVPVPTAMSDAQAASFSIGAQTAYAMLRRAEVGRDTTVLVTAATSMTSLFAISAACGRGARVYCLSRSGRGADLLAELGVVRSFDPNDPADLKDLARLARQIRGFDAVVDPFCDAYVLTAVKLIGFNGHYVTCRLMGSLHDEMAGTDTPGGHWLSMLTSLVSKNATIHGQCLGVRADLEAALGDWDAGRLRVVVDSEFSGADIGPFVRRTFDPARLGKAAYVFGDRDHDEYPERDDTTKGA